jgi:hypothetical protein
VILPGNSYIVLTKETLSLLIDGVPGVRKTKKNRRSKENFEAVDFNPFLLEDDVGFMLYKLEMRNEFLEYYRSMIACLTDEERDLLKTIKKPRYH